MFDLTGRTALVTGAGQGMGAGIAAALARQGASLIVNDLVPERAEAQAAALRAAGATAVAAPFDVTDGDAVAAGIDGPVDILVNNAGVPEDMDLVGFRDLDPERWRVYVDLNLYGFLHCARAVVGGMSDRGWGRIVQISSAAGRHGAAFGISLYGASKSGAEGFARHLAMEVAASGVTVNSLALGLMSNVVPGDGVDFDVSSFVRGIPVGRLGTPEDVGAAVVYLASDEAGWLTGQTIDLNGGAVQ